MPAVDSAPILLGLTDAATFRAAQDHLLHLRCISMLAAWQRRYTDAPLSPTFTPPSGTDKLIADLQLAADAFKKGVGL